MPPRACPSCTAENAPSAYACHRCNFSFLNAPDATGRKPYNVSFTDLLRGVLLTPLCVWLAFKFFEEGKAVFSFSRNATSFLEVSGPWSSMLGAIAIFMGAAAFGSMVADFFDTRANEHVYRKVLLWCLNSATAFFLLAVLVGDQLEHIKWITR